MSERWETTNQNWYSQSRTSNLEYLDLATTTSVSNSQIAHNLAVVYDRTCLSAQVNLRNFKTILKKCSNLEKEFTELKDALKTLTTVLLETRPLTKQEIVELVSHPKQEVNRLEEDLNHKIERVEKLLQ